MVGKSWSYADDRRVIELAKASKSLEEAVVPCVMNSTQPSSASPC